MPWGLRAAGVCGLLAQDVWSYRGWLMRLKRDSISTVQHEWWSIKYWCGKWSKFSWATKITEEGAIHNTKCTLASFASYCCDTDQGPKQLEEKEFILAYSSQSVVKKSQRRNLVQKPGSRNGNRGQEGTLLSVACSNSFWCSPEPNCPGVVFLLGPPTSTTNQENTSTDLPTCQLEGGPFLTEFSSSQITSACVKSTKI